MTLPASLPQRPLAAEPAARLEAYARVARDAFAPNTLKALASDARLFTAFCRAHGLDPLPAAAGTVLLWLDACAAAGHKPATVGRRLASIAHLHRAAGLPDPTRDERVRLAHRAYRRRHGTRQRQAAAIDRVAAGVILATTPRARPLDPCCRALLLASRDLLGRRSELAALDVADLTPNPDGSAAVLLRRSKTDQEGAGSTGWLSPAACSALRDYWRSLGITTGPAFLSRKTGGRITAAVVATRLKRMAARAGLDAAAVSGHSCRVGMAQDLVAAGFGLPEVMQAGRWRSPEMVARYTERQQAGRGAVARYHARFGQGG